MPTTVGIHAFCCSNQRHGWRAFAHHDGERPVSSVSLSADWYEISETNCDEIAKEDWISVYVSRTGRPHKALSFQYDPPDVDPFPVIVPIGPHSVQISVPWNAEVLFHRDGLKGLSLVYRVGGIEYPPVDPTKK